jgi:hypothetical protein
MLKEMISLLLIGALIVSPMYLGGLEKIEMPRDMAGVKAEIDKLNRNFAELEKSKFCNPNGSCGIREAERKGLPVPKKFVNGKEIGIEEVKWGDPAPDLRTEYFDNWSFVYDKDRDVYIDKTSSSRGWVVVLDKKGIVTFINKSGDIGHSDNPVYREFAQEIYNEIMGISPLDKHYPKKHIEDNCIWYKGQHLFDPNNPNFCGPLKNKWIYPNPQSADRGNGPPPPHKHYPKHLGD